METQPLYDLTPMGAVMLAGVALAVLPMFWVVWRHRHAGFSRRVHALTVLTFFLTFDLVLFGAFTRLTDSGLGCPDWPGCYGNASPLGAGAEITQAQDLQPTGAVTHSKAWVEMIHRYLATGVGALIALLALSAWLGRVRRFRDTQACLMSPWWPTLTLAWVGIQGAFGALTVTMKLFPAIVTLHLLGGLVLLALLCAQAVRLAPEPARRLVPAAPRELLWFAFGVLMLQVALGGWVSTNYAVLACSSFPKCQNSWWPPMNFSQGFHIWRELGRTSTGELIAFDALTAIHYAHRMAALLVLPMLGLLALRLKRVAGLGAQARWIALLVVLQLATGLSNVVLDWPLLAAVLHTGGAAALVAVLTWALAASAAPARVCAPERAAAQAGVSG